MCGNTSFHINEIGVIRLGHFGIGKRILTYTIMIPVWPNWAYAIAMESRHGKKKNCHTQKSTNVLGLIIDEGQLPKMRI